MCKFILPKFNFKIEKWKWNKEFRIYVSTLGNFKDEHKKNMPIKISSKNGYCMIKTPYGIKAAHRLVMLTFKPIPNAEDLTIDHLNHNKRCNELSNLEWVSREENAERAKKDLIQEKIIKTGKKFFMDLNEAAKWVIFINGNENCDDKPNLENIKRKIEKAIRNKTLYCNRKWEYKIR